MLNFDTRTGPQFTVAPQYPDLRVPEWYRDAKLGIFIHWGIYSVPGWAQLHGERNVQPEEAYALHEYAEWYGNTWRIPGSPTQRHHVETFGLGTSYEDLVDLWQAERFDATTMVSQVLRSGARYIIPTTKHHEGLCLWDTKTTPFSTAQRGPKRDLIAELHDAVRAAGVRFGVYFSGALDWHVSDLPPIQSDRDLFALRRNDAKFSQYSTRQMQELIARFSPDVLWNDIDWPDGGKGDEPYGLAALFRSYLSAVPDGVVNDRWGIPTHGFLTREYTHVGETLPHPWEACRGLGQSFGYNRVEDEHASMSGAELIAYLVDVVAKNGNLLINVGPRADGTIPELQLRALEELGAWLDVNGEAIFATRPWLRYGDGQVRYTHSEGTVYCQLLNPGEGELVLPAELSTVQTVEWLGGTETAVIDGVVEVPEVLRTSPVAVARVG
ncbi:alpha-L-fucosidase [Tessaracoccus lubricantis]|uniref:alpha-L-fucosidase n=1 Tax=Tessaracoccus lubricantis TaxID=545543 RepID=A0ABP9F9X2_9ACTN